MEHQIVQANGCVGWSCLLIVNYNVCKSVYLWCLTHMISSTVSQKWHASSLCISKQVWNSSAKVFPDYVALLVAKVGLRLKSFVLISSHHLLLQACTELFILAILEWIIFPDGHDWMVWIDGNLLDTPHTFGKTRVNAYQEAPLSCLCFHF